MRAVTKTVLGLGLTGAGVLGWASLVERNAFVLRRFDVPVLPEGAAPLRVLHLSDLHLLPRQRAKRAWVHSLASLDPDLVITTGDNIAAPDAVPALLDAYDRLLAIPGVFVLGSNDYFAPQAEEPPRLPDAQLREGHRHDPAAAHGRPRARPRVARLGRPDEPPRVADGARSADRRPRGRRPAPRLRPPRHRPRARARPTPTCPLGVTHAPYQRVLDAYAADGADLIVAGHTHGGQVCVPGYGALVTNCDLDTSRVKGLLALAAGGRLDAVVAGAGGCRVAHVSAGLGTAPTAPVRLACRPEATLLTLVPRSQA